MKSINLIVCSLFAVLLSSPLVLGALTDNLVAYYSMDETTGKAIDLANYTNNGSIEGTPVRGEAGVIDAKYRFKGGSDAVMINDSVDLRFVDEFSFSLWSNTTSLTAGGHWLSKWGAGARQGYYLGQGGSNEYLIQVTESDGSGVSITTTETINFSLWEHLVVIANGSDIVFYKNGVETDKVVYDGTVRGGNGNLTLGEQTGSVAIQGSIDEVGLWNRGLTPAEITELYNNGYGYSPFSSGSVLVTLDSPANDSFIETADVQLNATLIPSLVNLTNATFQVWNNTGSLINETTFEVTGNTQNSTSLDVTLGIGRYYWNVLGCGINQSSTVKCGVFESNLTFVKGFIFNDETHDANAVEFGNTQFILNVTLQPLLVSFDGYLVYNNTRNLASITTSGDDTIYTANVIAPNVGSATNVTWRWELELDDGDGIELFNVTDDANQTINILGIDDCTTYTNLLINFTLKDEGDLSVLTSPAPNTTIEIESLILTNSLGTASNFSQNYTNINPAQICVNDGVNASQLRLDVLVRYSADDYVVEYFNIQNATLTETNFPQNIDLLLLKATDSQEFLITYKDTNFLPVENALITITRKYVSDGLFRTIEAPLTDAQGRTLAHLVLGDVIYTIHVSKDGEVLAVFDNQRAVCNDLVTGDCQISLTAFSSGYAVQDLETNKSITFGFSLNRALRQISVLFNVLGGTTAKVSINGTILDAYQNNTVCTESITSSGGTLTCTIPQTYQNSTVLIDLYKDGEFVSSAIFNFGQDLEDIFGEEGKGSAIILGILLFITIPLMFISSPVGVVIGGIFGLILVFLLNLIDSTSLIGLGSTLIWFVLAGSIIIWKLTRRESGI